MPTRRNPGRRSDDRRSSGPLSAEELAGYLSGVRHRLDSGEYPEPLRDSVHGRLHEAAESLAAGRLAEAERALLDADASLDAPDEESELTEFPRGLVGYVPRGARVLPPERGEEALANRMLIVERLWEVRRADGFAVEALLPALHEAEAAYRAGDRDRARRLMDRVHSALEALGEARSARGET